MCVEGGGFLDVAMSAWHPEAPGAPGTVAYILPLNLSQKESKLN